MNITNKGENNLLFFIILIPALLISFLAQMKVSSTFKKYSKVTSKTGYTGYTIATKILNDAGIHDVQVLGTGSDKMGDHFDPKRKVIKLSNNVYNSSSVAALGVAAHECGHAIQHQRSYIPNTLRSALVPVANLGSMASIPLFLIGLLFSLPYLQLAGIIFFGLTTVFYIVTLPVEFNASIRAVKILSGSMDSTELSGVKNVLTAAAFTYIAAVLMSLAQLLRLVALSRRN